MTPEQVALMNIALNEASLVRVELDQEGRRFGVTLAVRSLPAEGGPPPSDPRIKLTLEPLGRMAVSWRHARWDDPNASPDPLSPEELPAVIAAFGQLPIYGWHFFDAGAEAFDDWSSRLSMDLELGPERAHTLDLFQEGNEEFLELRVWFCNLTIARESGGELVTVPIDEIGEAGKRWWDGMFGGDPRTRDSGIYPLKG